MKPLAPRARLKIFFGFASGVGKTHAMLESARRLRAEGADVVAGWVETHGRPETAALLEGLETLPRRAVAGGAALAGELDLERALARRPRVLLVDDVAHVNAPGLRHARRWQDVLDLLDAGIEVHTTLNVQQIESLNDVVAQITGFRPRETVPDAVLDRADEIELCDLAPEELLERLREGKVRVPPEAAPAGTGPPHVFQRGSLLALRELALRRTADRVDADVLEYRRAHAIETTWPASERILVCVGPSPASSRLVRAARRMAAGLRAPWVAAYVQAAGAAAPGPGDQQRLDAHLRLAESLGGEAVRLAGPRVGRTLLEYARRHNVTRIVIGKPTHSRLRDVLRGSVLDEVVRGSGDIDVHVISGDEGPAADAPGPAARVRAAWGGYAWAAGLVTAATAVSALARPLLSAEDTVMLYLLGIMVVAARFGRGPSVAAAALSVGAYDFFFVPPYYTFNVANARHLLTFAMMFGVGLVISALTLRVRRQEHEARLREERTATLYALSRDLGVAVDEGAVAEVVARHAWDVFAAGAAVLLPDGAAAPRVAARRGDLVLEAPELDAARWVLEHGRPAGRGTETLPEARVACHPLLAGGEARGVLALAPGAGRAAPADARHFLDAFARQATLALERARLAEDAKAAALRARTEQMRSSLLSAVSHDLRTPLAAITGAATALRDDAAHVSAGDRADLLETICEEAERLERLVGNLLDMTRLDSGVQPKREWVPLEEIVGTALERLDRRLEGRAVTADLAADLPLVPVDPVLLELVFVNLLENAAKYTPPASPIEVRARRDGGAAVLVEVADRGPGLPAGAEEKVFEKFYRGPHVGVAGVGLGLPICRGVVEAHGGTIAGTSRSGGGALFRITLPIVGRAPAMLEDAGAEAHTGAGPA
ncbi:MAG TPA: sensor histidine kinase KdpD, partial [Myxococcota bacterium]|nr:sensor histidine kinase KdpD [Myxococcota bacterium]